MEGINWCNYTKTQQVFLERWYGSVLEELLRSYNGDRTPDPRSMANLYMLTHLRKNLATMQIVVCDRRNEIILGKLDVRTLYEEAK